jgi:AraC-like DNA-binding protein
MSDFASAAMVRVLVRGMRQQGLQPPEAALRACTEPAASAIVTLELKRQVVQSALQQGGLACLALLGQGVHHDRNDPTHLALASARDAADLFRRWSRLERYVHSRHRCELLAIGDDEAQLQHVARHNAAPLVAEDLVVLGLLAALLQASGFSDVRAWAGGAAVLPNPDIRGLERVAARPGASAEWRLAWRGRPIRPRAVEADAARPTMADLLVSADWPAPLHHTARELLADLTQPPPLAALARRLGWAPRSLQRALSHAGLGYAPLLAELRCRAGAWWLLHSQASIAELGFVCGYADQSHFTRELRRRVGMTPARYREAFGTAPGH